MALRGDATPFHRIAQAIRGTISSSTQAVRAELVEALPF
jgi:hypothetical protein